MQAILKDPGPALGQLGDLVSDRIGSGSSPSSPCPQAAQAVGLHGTTAARASGPTISRVCRR